MVEERSPKTKKPPLRGGWHCLSVRMPHITVKVAALVAVPPGVVTWIFPVIAPGGTVAVTLVAEFTVKEVAFTPPKLTAVV